MKDLKSYLNESLMDLLNTTTEILKNKENVTIINDCYNASYESVKAALEYVSSLKANRIVLTPSILASNKPTT